MITFDNIDAVDGSMDCFLMADGGNCQKPFGYALDPLKLRKASREYDACVAQTQTGVTQCVKPVGYNLDLLRLRPASKAYDECMLNQSAMIPPMPTPDGTTTDTGAGLDTRGATSDGGTGLPTWAVVSIIAGGVVVLGGIGYFLLKRK